MPPWWPIRCSIRSSSAAHVDAVDAPPWYDGTHSAPNRRIQLVETALGRLAQMPAQRVGIELSSVPAGVLEGLRACARGSKSSTSRRSSARCGAKDPDEIDVLGRSMRAGERAQAAALAQVAPGMTELDVYRIVQNAAMAELGEPAIVYGDFASGPRPSARRGGRRRRA